MKRLLVFIVMICLCFIGCSKNDFDKSILPNINKEEGKNFVTEYLDIRYEGVNKDNIDERYIEQESYYSNSMLESPLWANLPDNIEASKRERRAESFASLRHEA